MGTVEPPCPGSVPVLRSEPTAAVWPGLRGSFLLMGRPAWRYAGGTRAGQSAQQPQFWNRILDKYV